MEKKLEVKDLRISFRTAGGKVQAVRNISFDLNKGETLSIVGESGSGKSVTSRAIIGILAGNAIVESGEILYDGKDLLKIDEEEFHKIRGDKIAMIFQDPLSSLNPIMKIGKQLTEAMLLKNAAAKRGARRDFRNVLKHALENANEVMCNGSNDKEVVSSNKKVLDTYKKYVLHAIVLENEYNEAKSAIDDGIMDLEDLVLHIDKEQKVDLKQSLGTIIKIAKQSYNIFLIRESKSDLPSIINVLEEEKKLVRVNSLANETVTKNVKEMLRLFKEARSLEKPDFFALSYYLSVNPELKLEDALFDGQEKLNMPIAELNNITNKTLEEGFLVTFRQLLKSAVENSYEKSMSAKKVVLEKIEGYLPGLSADTLHKDFLHTMRNDLAKAVEDSIDKMQVIKDTLAYTFKSSFSTAVHKYLEGVKNNPKEQAKYDKQLAKRDKELAKGKEITWKIVPPSLVDLDVAKSNILSVINTLRNAYANQVEQADYDIDAQVERTIEFLENKASSIMYTVTRRMARNIALKLMEEVGIPEPRRRFRQYPFEFSGGMRQRIVIAIALAANPDILICDEPTTALDVTIQAQILELINNLKEERHLSVIFITHDLGVVANMADRIAVMYAGKIVEYGTAMDVFYNPQHPYTWALLASMPDLDTNEKLDAIPGTPPNMIYPPVGDAFAVRNKYALEIDFEMQPPIFQISDTHFAATWLLHPDAPKVEPPRIVTERIERMNKRAGGVQ